MINWRYQDGAVAPTRVQLPDENEDDVATILRSLGYEAGFDLGPGEYSFSASVYHRANNGQTSYLVELTVGGMIEYIAVDNLPDLLEFLPKLTPVIELAMRTDEEQGRREHADLHRSRDHEGCRYCEQRGSRS